MSFPEIVRQVAAEHSDEPDYRALSEHVLKAIEGEEKDLLRKLLPNYMKSILTRRQGAEWSEDVWERALNERLPSVSGEYVFVRDASADDIAKAAAERRRFSGNLDHRAAHLEGVVREMRSQNVATVGALDVGKVGESLDALDRQLYAEKLRRVKATNRARVLGVLLDIRARVLHELESGEYTLVLMLEARRDALVQRIELAKMAKRKGEIADETFKEMFDA